MAKFQSKFAGSKTAYGRTNMVRQAISEATELHEPDFTIENFQAGLFPGTWEIPTAGGNYFVFKLGKSGVEAAYVSPENEDLRPDEGNETTGEELEFALSWGIAPAQCSDFNQFWYKKQYQILEMSWNDIWGCYTGKSSAVRVSFAKEYNTKIQQLKFKLLLKYLEAYNDLPKYLAKARFAFNGPSERHIWWSHIENRYTLKCSGEKTVHYTF